jgi:hypothetical protein
MPTHRHRHRLYVSISLSLFPFSLSHSFCARSLPHTLHTPLIIISSHDDKLSNGVEITCAHAKALWLGRTINMPQPRQPKRNLPSACAQSRRHSSHVPVYPRTPTPTLAHTVALCTSEAIDISPAPRMHTRDHGQKQPIEKRNVTNRHAYTGTRRLSYQPEAQVASSRPCLSWRRRNQQALQPGAGFCCVSPCISLLSSPSPNTACRPTMRRVRKEMMATLIA